MTWYVHGIGAPIEKGMVYHSALEAQGARADGQTISVVLSAAEHDTWTRRERDRLCDGTYLHAPASLVQSAPPGHFPHLSRVREGMVAYTPSPEKGHRDKRDVITPCRYLVQFCPQVDAAGREAICGEVRAALEATMHRATTADEIERVYNIKTSWTSCMAGHYQSGSGQWMQRWNSGGISGDRHTPSPVRAYGDSDLALVWLGTLGATPEQDTLIARAVVWPERKQYVRVYGDQPRLVARLDAEGWERVSSFDGAQIRRIVLPNRELSVPYVDGTDRAKVDASGEWLRLGSGGVNTSSQDGQVCDHAALCRRAGCRREVGDSSEDNLCDRCYDAQCTCIQCDEVFEDSDEGITSAAGEWYCQTCADERAFSCDCCGEPVQPLEIDESLDNDGFCVDCQDATRCEACDEWTVEECVDGKCPPCVRTEALNALTLAVQTACDAGATALEIAAAVVTR